MTEETHESTLTTPDGAREVTNMLVSVPGRLSQLVRLRGANLPDLIASGSPDLAASRWLEMVNRSATSGHYTQVDFVSGGMIRIQPMKEQKHPNFISSKFGGHFGEGSADLAKVFDDVGEHDISMETNGLISLWAVTDTTGPQVLAWPVGDGDVPNSAEIIEIIAPYLKGQFCIERLDTVQVKVAANPFVPGWAITVDRAKSFGAKPVAAQAPAP